MEDDLTHQFQSRLDGIRRHKPDLPLVVPDDSDHSFEALGIRDRIAAAFKEYGAPEPAQRLWLTNYQFSGRHPARIRCAASAAADISDEALRALLKEYPSELAMECGEPEELQFACAKLYALQDMLPRMPHADDASIQAQDERRKYILAFSRRGLYGFAMFLALRNLFQSPERNYASALALAVETGNRRALDIIEATREGETSWAEFGYYAAIQLNWDVFPTGSEGGRYSVESWEASRIERPPRGCATLDLIDRYRPKTWFKGTFDTGPNGGQYYIALFARIAIAESDHYGNATYLTSAEDWSKVFRRSRAEARNRGAIRLKHTDGWEPRIIEILEAEQRGTQSHILDSLLAP